MNIPTLDALTAHCAALPPMQAEAHYRRFVARHEQNLQAWNLLLRCLVVQRNQVEVNYLLDQFLLRHGHHETGRRYAVLAYFHIGNHVQAHRLSLQLQDRQLAGQEELAQIVTLLQWLHGPGQQPFAPPRISNPLHQALQDFNQGALPVPVRGVDVAFFLKSDWHYSIQQGVAAHLRQRGVCCMFLRSIWAVIAARPRVLVVSDALAADLGYLRQYLPDCRIVYTRHGLGDKNYAYHAAGQADVTCLSSPDLAQDFSSQALMARERLWITGYPQMDALFQQLARHPGPPGRRTVLVAPTFTSGLHAGEILGPRLVESIRGADESIRIMIRPHPHWRKTHPELVQAWAEQARSQPGVSLHDGDEICLMDLFESADLMVSDVSSAGLAWLATGRPLICVADPAMARSSPFYAPDGLEWRMHQAGDSVQDRAALAAAVRQALDQPASPNAAYRALRQHLFGDLTDGRASERIAAHIEQWLAADQGRAGAP